MKMTKRFFSCCLNPRRPQALILWLIILSCGGTLKLQMFFLFWWASFIGPSQKNYNQNQDFEQFQNRYVDSLLFVMMRIFHFAWSKTADESQIEYDFFWGKGWVHLSGQNKNCRTYPCAHQFIGQRELDHWLVGRDIVSRWRERERERSVLLLLIHSVVPFSLALKIGPLESAAT